MARGKSKTAAKSDVIYLKVDLPKDVKATLMEWLGNKPDLLDLIEKSIDSGLKFGSTFDHYNECFQATFTRNGRPNSDEITQVLVGRGGTLQQAIEALLFKHYVLLNEEWEENEYYSQRVVSDWG